ncbi:MAG: hypothetical protein QOG05_3348, partial [Streptosporangiaceae bacterium]|nr:hypothetical protein [Streptosporangiaceae bacterium]
VGDAAGRCRSRPGGAAPVAVSGLIRYGRALTRSGRALMLCWGQVRWGLIRSGRALMLSWGQICWGLIRGGRALIPCWGQIRWGQIRRGRELICWGLIRGGLIRRRLLRGMIIRGRRAGEVLRGGRGLGWTRPGGSGPARRRLAGRPGAVVGIRHADLRGDDRGRTRLVRALWDRRTRSGPCGTWLTGGGVTGGGVTRAGPARVHGNRGGLARAGLIRAGPSGAGPSGASPSGAGCGGVCLRGAGFRHVRLGRVLGRRTGLRPAPRAKAQYPADRGSAVGTESHRRSAQPEIHVDGGLLDELRVGRVEFAAGRVDPGERGLVHGGHQRPGGLEAERAVDPVSPAG